MTEESVFIICLFVLFAIIYADYRLGRSNDNLKDKIVEEARDELVEDYENLADWIKEAEQLKSELTALRDELKLKLELSRPARDKLGRFTKKA